MIEAQYLRSLYHSVFYNVVHRRAINRPSTLRLNGLQLVVEPAVHHPSIFKSGRILAHTLSKLDLRNRAVLDMGTGSGILGLSAAAQGARVIAVDKDPAAVRCATENVRRNGLEARVTVVEGDLFSAIPGDRFDLILFNPPYFVKETGSFRDVALYGGRNLKLVSDFAKSAPDHLTADGTMLMIVSTDSDMDRFLQIFRDLKYENSLLETKRTLFEDFFVYKFSPSHIMRTPSQ